MVMMVISLILMVMMVISLIVCDCHVMAIPHAVRSRLLSVPPWISLLAARTLAPFTVCERDFKILKYRGYSG